MRQEGNFWSEQAIPQWHSSAETPWHCHAPFTHTPDRWTSSSQLLQHVGADPVQLLEASEPASESGVVGLQAASAKKRKNRTTCLYLRKARDARASFRYNVAPPVRVLFVSKPVVPPFDDGSKCLVRDVAGALKIAEPTVMVSPGAPPLGPRVRRENVYGVAQRFSPSPATLALNRLLFGDPLDLWHFVFAPNTASSSGAKLAIRARRSRGWPGKVVQTVASRPKSFDGARSLIFGDRVVALSEWTRGKLLQAGVPDSVVRVIPPCVREPAPRHTPSEVRAALEVGDGPLIVYPGDLHVSSGAATVALAVGEVLRAVPGARFVFACRDKGRDVASYEAGLREALRGLEEYVRIAGRVDDMHGLLAAADVVAFPVDDLYGKVDLPIVLLESMALGTPLVLASGGPLDELPGEHVPPDDPAALAEALVRLCRDEAARESLAGVGRETWRARHTPEVVGAQHDALYVELC